MVIDTHVHIFETPEVYPASYLEQMYHDWMEKFGKERADERRAAFDGRVEVLLKDMGEAGVDKSVVSPWDIGLLWDEEPKISIWRSNEYIAECQGKYSDRIIGFVGVDPLRKDAIELLEKGITKWGLQGAKVFMSKCKVTDERVQPFMEKANELELPVLFHTGMDSLPYLMQNGNPVDLNTLMLRCPKLNIIAAHVSRGWEHLLVEILSRSGEAMATDICGYQRLYLSTYWHFIQQMRYLMDRIPSLVLMGSDWPFLKGYPMLTHKEWFDVIRNLKIPEPVLQLGLGIKDFSQQEKDLILGGNAKRFLGIE